MLLIRTSGGLLERSIAVRTTRKSCDRMCRSSASRVSHSCNSRSRSGLFSDWQMLKWRQSGCAWVISHDPLEAADHQRPIGVVDMVWNVTKEAITMREAVFPDRVTPPSTTVGYKKSPRSGASKSPAHGKIDATGRTERWNSGTKIPGFHIIQA